MFSFLLVIDYPLTWYYGKEQKEDVSKQETEKVSHSFIHGKKRKKTADRGALRISNSDNAWMKKSSRRDQKKSVYGQIYSYN